MPVAQVVHSVCPSIFGHNLVKLALALSLFGGIVKHVGTDNPDEGAGNLTKGTDNPDYGY
jgi:DNA helicase MCM8